MLNTILLQEAQSAGGGMMSLLMIAAMVVIFYFFMILPQKKQQKKLQQQRDALQKGDKVVTAGGLHGKIKGINPTTFEVEVAPGVSLTVEKSCVTPTGAGAPATQSETPKN